MNSSPHFELRPFQKEALSRLKQKGHLICIAPTGSGKSLIYERFAQETRARTLLVSPLVALARQQYERLKSLGVQTTLSAGNPGQAAPKHRTGVWIISPETLLYPSRRDALRRWGPEFLVVDECHCLWDWGDGFRPAFLPLPRLIEWHSIERSLWLTATLPYPAREALVKELPDPCVEIGTFDLPTQLELRLLRVQWKDRTFALLKWVERQAGAGIIFVSTREASLRITQLLAASGKRALPYHAGMSAEERKSIELKVASQAPEVIVATSAFGMGMDFSHLKWVALWQAPFSLLALAQTIGRVGRGLQSRAQALVLWHEDDFRLSEWMIQGSERKRQELIQTLEFLRARRCRRNSLARYFEGSDSGAVACVQPCGRCDFCLEVKNDSSELYDSNFG